MNWNKTSRSQERQSHGVAKFEAADGRRVGASRRWVGFLLGLALFATENPLRAQFVITEFMAANSRALNDEDGDNSDWIEIHNSGPTPASLAGWFLTDSASNLAKWSFPATNLPANGYLVVFASEKNRRAPGRPLHTNFKLGADGEYLALVAPDRTNVASHFAPVYPPQVDDVSYGLVRDVAAVTFLGAGAPVRALVPQNDNLDLTWTEVEFNDSAWVSGTTALGYDRQTVGVNFLPLLGLNVETMMYPNHGSIYARIPFTVANPGDWSGLVLRLKFEDGFIAYLNGQEVARSNAPVNTAFNSLAVGPRTDTLATNAMDFDLSEFRGFLFAGTNVLAFQVLNNPTNSPDLLLLPQLDGLTVNGPPVPRYFPSSTPGRPNNSGVLTVGPVISEPTYSPAEPTDAEHLTVTARIRPAFASVASATLRYRVMFGPEVGVPFVDDGAHGDGGAGDGIYGATIPAGASTPGQMVRWYMTAIDSTGTNVSRYPTYTDTNNSPAYLGTVVVNPALTNALPVFHWFVQNVPAADTTAGTRASVYWNGEFYDNVFNRIRGASAATFFKKPYKFDFNPGDHFRFRPGHPRADELNLNATHHDKTYLRAPVSFETYRQAGSLASDAFNVRVQQNNSFFSVAVFVEQVDDTYLEKRGLDPNGALYKMFNGLTSASSGVEKKTRRGENNADLQQLVAGLSPTNPNRGAFIHDQFDLPALINHLAAGVLIQDLDRTFKNYYLYRDVDGSGLWQILPWDKDLTFGLFGLQSDCLSGSDDSLPYDGCRGGRISHPLFGSQGRTYPSGVNNAFDAVFNYTPTREMFLRRVRTLMDQFLQPPGTPIAERRYERRLDELAALLRADAVLDFNRWRGAFGLPHDLPTALGRLKAEYLEDRRKHLYLTHNVANSGQYPDVAGIPQAQTDSPPLRFGTVEFNPSSGRQEQEYIELINPNPIAVDLSGWRLEGGVEFRFAPGSVVPANGRVYVSPNRAAFRLRSSGPRGGQGLLVVGDYVGQLSARGESLRLRDASGMEITTNAYVGSPSAVQQYLRITEIMYQPLPLSGSALAVEEFAYLEFKNVSSDVTLNLAGVRVVNGVEFNFTGSAVTTLAPGATLLVVKNSTAFVLRYGAGHPVAGQYTGSLAGEGERIRVVDATGEEVLDFAYEDDWQPITDGLGFSLVAVNELAEPDAWNSASHWRSSAAINGSPAVTDPTLPAIPRILINEVLSRTDTPPPTDAVELWNPTTAPVNVGGWFLSDDPKTPKKYRLVENSVISAGEFLVLTEANYNSGGLGFAFSSFGDEVWLFSGDAQTNLTGYAHGFRFGAAEDGISFGRYQTSDGAEHFVAQSDLSMNAPNGGPRVGPVVISEIHYHPPESATGYGSLATPLDILLGDSGAAAEKFEFLELQNISAHPVVFHDPERPTNTWSLRGDVEFDFPTGFELPPGATLLLVNFAPLLEPTMLARFRAAYGIDLSVPILGPFAGSLPNTGGRLELQKPDAPNGAELPKILLDAVRYRDEAPWPTAADGGGGSLQRLVISAYGNDPTNWFASGLSPGLPNQVNVPPSVSFLSPANGAGFGLPASVNLQVQANDVDGSVVNVEFYADEQKLGEVVSSPYALTWTSASPGSHRLTARATDNQFATTVSAPVTIRVSGPPPSVTLNRPTNGAVLLSGDVHLLTAAASAAGGFISKVEFYANQGRLGEVTVAPYIFEWSNALAGAYSLQAIATDNAGQMVTSSLVEVIVMSGSLTNSTLISTGAVWKYFDQGVDLGSDWRAPGFSDAAWPSGPAQLGYGDGDEATTNSFGSDGLNRYITTYYRRAFLIRSAAAYSTLNVRVLRDDGAVVYLNGTEVFRTGMPDGPVAFSTLANITVTGDDESIHFYDRSLDPRLIVEGTNVLAVEIHQRSGDSSDISFDLELSGSQMLLTPALVLNTAGELWWPAPSDGFVLQMANNLQPPIAWQTADLSGRTQQNGFFKLPIPRTASNRFYRLARP